jgi:hypothetical protein
MKTISVAKAFKLNIGGKMLDIPAGVQAVDDAVADHWYTKVHLSGGGLGAPAYAAGARASADTAYVKAKEALALYAEMEKAALDAETAAKVEVQAPAFERLGPLPDLEEQFTAPHPAPPPAPPEPATPTDFDAMSDDDLRALIKARDGRTPHPATSRDKLLAAAGGDKATSAEIEADVTETGAAAV